MRHARFPVDEAARNRWMELMNRAMSRVDIPQEAAAILREYFESTASAMMNRL